MILAFLAVYIIWGSTYLAIRIVVDTMPPFFMAASRFIIAGMILFFLAKLRGDKKPSKNQWKEAFMVGGFLLLGGNGIVVWAEQWVPSGLTSLVLATMPLWLVLLNSIQERKKPGFRLLFGILLGFIGVALLIGSVNNLGGDTMIIPATIMLIFAALSWAAGSLYSRSTKTKTSQLQLASMHMIAGGILLSIVGLVSGEYTNIILNEISSSSVFSWLYLIIFGSIIAFTSYIWLLKQTNPALVSTHAYINPIVALILGFFLANEVLTAENILAAIIIIMSVALITSHSFNKHNK